MYRDDVAPSRIQRMLNASWPLFHAFDVEVRVHWFVIVVPFLLFGMLVEGQYPAGEAAIWAPILTFALYLTVWTHEMAHIGAGRQFGIPARLITLSPLGGLAHMDSPAPSPRAEILTALAGPATQLGWLVVLGIPFVLFDVKQRLGLDMWADVYSWFLGFQAVVMVFNLIPSYPLDGGRVLRGILARRMHANKASLYTAYAGYAGGIVLGIVGLAIWFQAGGDGQVARLGGVSLVWIGAENFLACRRLQMEAQYSASPYDAGESWKTGNATTTETWSDSIAESGRLSRAEERRERREAEARRNEEMSRRKVQERIDELLDRINELGGIERLSDAERRELAEASELLRRETAGR